MNPVFASACLSISGKVFVPCSLMYLKEPLTLDFLWAALRLLEAVFSCFLTSWPEALCRAVADTPAS